MINGKVFSKSAAAMSVLSACGDIINASLLVGPFIDIIDLDKLPATSCGVNGARVCVPEGA